MWKRNESSRSPAPAPPRPEAPTPAPAPADQPSSAAVASEPQARPPIPGPSQAGAAADPYRNLPPGTSLLGRAMTLTGEIRGDQDLIVAGRLEGQIDLPGHALTVAREGSLKAQVFARVVIVLGEVRGDMTASERIEIRESARVYGELVAPVVSIAEGAMIQGRVETRKTDAAVRVARYRMERKASNS